MDRVEPFTFEAGDSGPTSDLGGDTSQRDGTGSNVAGRIDPAIARATSGGDNAQTVTPSEPGQPGADNSGGETGAGPTATGAAPRRGRGRPRKDQSQPGQTGNIETPSAPASGAKNIRVSFIEKTLMGIHLGVAAISKCPELEIGKEDAKLLAEGVAGVLALYKVRMTAKQEAYGLLIEAAGQVYVPMAVSVYFRKKMEAEAAAKTRPAPPSPQPRPPAPMTTAADPKAPASPAPAATAAMPDGFDPGNISIPQ